MENGSPSDPVSAIEFAVDLHATAVISANNYQRCITALWRGYYNVQYSEDDRLIFDEYEYLNSRRWLDHFDIQRIKGHPPSRKRAEISPAVFESVELVLHSIVFGVVYDRCEYTERSRGD